MSEYDELVGKLRTYYGDDLACRMLLMDARHALEAMAGEVERLKDQNTAWADKYGDTQNAMYAALDERDRLKAALEPFAKLSTDRERQDPPEGTMRVRVVTAPEIEAARKALGGDAS